MLVIAGTDVAELLDLQDKVLPQVLKFTTRILGLAVFAALIIGGFQWLTASGDPKQIERARSTLTAAAISLAVVVIGWFGLNIIGQLFFDTTLFDITILNLKFPTD